MRADTGRRRTICWHFKVNNQAEHCAKCGSRMHSICATMAEPIIASKRLARHALMLQASFIIIVCVPANEHGVPARECPALSRRLPIHRHIVSTGVASGVKKLVSTDAIFAAHTPSADAPRLMSVAGFGAGDARPILRCMMAMPGGVPISATGNQRRSASSACCRAMKAWPIARIRAKCMLASRPYERRLKVAGASHIDI